MRLAGFKGRHEAQLSETPMTIAAIPELGDDLPDLFEVAQEASVDDRLL